ncbi:MAG TPA: NAD(P)H-hydrate dehydratase [Syntrophales bacterium]|nr:NAD(P)H-hydrate dehydratase [Syntrophales bacterium]
MKISRVSEMRFMDRYAVEKLDIPEEILMENAGQAAAHVLAEEVGIRDRRFVVFCGIGNNGGDGLVVARKIHSNGGLVKVFVAGDAKKFKGAARANWNMISKLPVETRRIASADEVRKDVLHCDAIVDALLGTGLDREVIGLHKEVIELVNASGRKVLSLDIPSGVHGDTGEILGAAISADYTVTFGLPKIGTMFYPGYELCGKLFVSHISFPPSLYNSDALKVEINGYLKLPPRGKDVYKGRMGDILVIAGAGAYFGAPYFSALSFLKAGGGYSRLAAPQSITPVIAAKGSEIVFVPQKETKAGSIALENRDSLIELAEKVDMVVIGPGLSLEEETQQLTRELVHTIKKPILIDGDGITAIADQLEMIRERKGATILTPHVGEMARIAKKDAGEISGQKIDILQLSAMSLHAIIVLKGAHTLIGYPDERVFINLSGNPGMATAGSGDVLTGTIAAMFGLGLSLEDAVNKGVFIHGFAGDLAAADKGEDGITAQDILDYLPLAMKYDREGPLARFRGIYEGPEVV